MEMRRRAAVPAVEPRRRDQCRGSGGVVAVTG